MNFSVIVFGLLVAYVAAATLEHGPVISVLHPADLAQQIENNRDKRSLIALGLLGAGIAGVAGLGAVGLGAGIIGAKAGLIGGALVGSALHSRSYGGGYGYSSYGHGNGYKYAGYGTYGGSGPSNYHVSEHWSNQ